MAEEPGRNDPCPCGSGKKYKKCCLAKKSAKRALSATLLSNSSKGLSSLIMSQGKQQIDAQAAALKKKEEGSSLPE